MIILMIIIMVIKGMKLLRDPKETGRSITALEGRNSAKVRRIQLCMYIFENIHVVEYMNLNVHIYIHISNTGLTCICKY
jgi:hypothetical protein